MKKILTGFIVGIVAGAAILFFVNEKWPVAGLFKGSTTFEAVSPLADSTEFSSITSKLERNGDLFAYLNTSKLAETIQRSVATLKETVTSDEKMGESRKAEAEKWFTFLNNILKESGLLEISALGISSKEFDKGFTRSKFVIQHDPGKGNGLLWNMSTKNSGDLSSIDLLPEDTVFASFSDMNYSKVWKWLKDQAEKSGDDKIRFGLTSMEKDLKDNGVDLNSLLSSINGETGFIITLDNKNIKEYPAPHKKINFPDPGAALIFETSNDLIFNLLSTKIPDVKIIEKDGLKSIEIKTPNMPFTFTPQIVQAEHMLILATRPELVTKILNGSGKKGLRNNEEFIKLSRGMPDSGSGFTYLSQTLFSQLMRIQREVNPGDIEAQNKGMEVMKKMGFSFDNLSVFRVIQKTGEGYTLTTNTTMKMEMLMILPAAAVGGVIAAVMIPQLIKNRQGKFTQGEQPPTPPSREL